MKRLEPIAWPPLILSTAAGFTITGILFIFCWIETGDAQPLNLWFQEFGAFLLVAFPLSGAFTAARVVSLFGPEEPMRQSWLLLATAAAIQAASHFVRHILGRDILLNPLRPFPDLHSWMPALDEFGRLLGGVLFPAVLITGLVLALRTYLRLGLLPKLSTFDFLVLAVLAILLACHLLNAFRWLGDPRVRPTPLLFLNLTIDPLYAALFVVAIFLRRAKLSLRHGLIERCWTAYSWAIFLTCAGSLAITLNAQGALPDRWMWPTWVLWHPAAALFALGPAYQLETMEMAMASASIARLRLRF
jgi:hypothetical protein